jgi:DNA-binding NtrC family response regulator
LILGETGVGKEELANVIHGASDRSNRPFVVVNCAAIAESLFEREIFGHKKGSFTNATSDEPGYFEQANGGTLLLDEIGELPRNLQCKLLRIVEDRRAFRVGDPKPRPLDVRIIAATNQDLETCVGRGTFRSDLYHRLKAVELHVPSLRERPADIVPIAEYLLDDERRGFGLSKSVTLSPEAIDCLMGYDYPGNVREFRYALSTAILQCRGESIRPEHLPRRMTGNAQIGLEAEETCRRTRRRAIESERILWALEQTAGNQTRAARMIGMPLRTFVSRLDRLGIPRPKKMTAHARPPLM